MKKNLFILLTIIFIYCKAKQPTAIDSPKAIQPTFSINGKNLSKHTLDLNIPAIGKGKILSYLTIRKDLVSQLDFYLIKDFDVFYKLPIDKKKQGRDSKFFEFESCLETPNNKIELYSVKVFPLSDRKECILILYQCLRKENLIEENYILDIYSESEKGFQFPIRKMVKSDFIKKLNLPNSEAKENLRKEIIETLK
jgi:hypothetical protein